jgi:hypothetical protein
MNYEIEIVNPKTNEQKKIVVELSPDQLAAAKASPYLETYVVDIARPQIPDGFLPIGQRVRPVTNH